MQDWPSPQNKLWKRLGVAERVGGMLTVCQQAIIPAKVEQYLHVARYIMFRPESRKESHIQDAVHYFVSVNGQILKQVRR